MKIVASFEKKPEFILAKLSGHTNKISCAAVSTLMHYLLNKLKDCNRCKLLDKNDFSFEEGKFYLKITHYEETCCINELIYCFNYMFKEQKKLNIKFI